MVNQWEDGEKLEKRKEGEKQCERGEERDG